MYKRLLGKPSRRMLASVMETEAGCWDFLCQACCHGFDEQECVAHVAQEQESFTVFTVYD